MLVGTAYVTAATPSQFAGPIYAAAIPAPAVVLRKKPTIKEIIAMVNGLLESTAFITTCATGATIEILSAILSMVGEEFQSPKSGTLLKNFIPGQ